MLSLVLPGYPSPVTGLAGGGEITRPVTGPVWRGRDQDKVYPLRQTG